MKGVLSMKEFTKEDLKNNNGKDGRPAYVAVDGIVYDVTNNNHWTDGQHHGNLAGQDLTEEIKSSPHGKDILKKINKVGILTG